MSVIPHVVLKNEDVHFLFNSWPESEQTLWQHVSNVLFSRTTREMAARFQRAIYTNFDTLKTCRHSGSTVPTCYFAHFDTLKTCRHGTQGTPRGVA